MSILAELHWKSISFEPPNDEKISQDHQNPHLLGQINLEITLTKHLPAKLQNSNYKNYTRLNDKCLLDDAFRPKSFIIKIEQGNFAPPSFEIGHTFDLKYTKRLIFNISPYPPESEWKESWKEIWLEPEGHNWWDCKEFVGHFLSSIPLKYTVNTP